MLIGDKKTKGTMLINKLLNNKEDLILQIINNKYCLVSIGEFVANEINSLEKKKLVINEITNLCLNDKRIYQLFQETIDLQSEKFLNEFLELSAENILLPENEFENKKVIDLLIKQQLNDLNQFIFNETIFTLSKLTNNDNYFLQIILDNPPIDSGYFTDFMGKESERNKLFDSMYEKITYIHSKTSINIANEFYQALINYNKLFSVEVKDNCYHKNLTFSIELSKENPIEQFETIHKEIQNLTNIHEEYIIKKNEYMNNFRKEFDETILYILNHWNLIKINNFFLNEEDNNNDYNEFNQNIILVIKDNCEISDINKILTYFIMEKTMSEEEKNEYKNLNLYSVKDKHNFLDNKNSKLLENWALDF